MLSVVAVAGLLAAGTPTETPHQRIEAAVMSNKLAPLLAIRDTLRTAIEKSQPAKRADLQYLLGYVDWRANHLLRGNKHRCDERAAILKEAQANLEAVVKARPNHGEAHALLASILGARIEGSFFLGFTLGPRASSLLDKAVELAPQSPRVFLLRGIRSIFTPSTFGGGLEVAQAELDRAFTLFAREAGKTSWPNWGRMDIFAWRGQVAARRGDRAGARALYERALEEIPDAGWIRDDLLPALERDRKR